MADHDPGFAPKYVAVLPHVKEIGLLGTSDLAFWRERLEGDGLVPTDFDGKARVLISAIESRFLGVTFRELCVSLFASRDGEDGLYLALAFNTSRLFAAVERAFFSTPYERGTVELNLRPPASVRLTGNSGSVMRAAMSDGPGAAHRVPIRMGFEGWEGVIFLPRDGRACKPQAPWFFARIGGETRAYAFSAPADSVTFGPSPVPEALRWVIESGFSGLEWTIREDSSHARTKTFTSPTRGPIRTGR